MDTNLLIERKAMQRSADRLLSMAALAERAACRYWPARCFVLWLLRFAESRARAFAAEYGYLVTPLLPAEGHALGPDNSPGAALHLAHQLRLLAAVFRMLAHEALLIARQYLGQRSDPRRQPCGRQGIAVWFQRLAAALQPHCADTS